MKHALLFSFLILGLSNTIFCSSSEKQLTPKSQAAENMREACYSDESDEKTFLEYQKNLVCLTSLDPQRAAQELCEKEEFFDIKPFFKGGSELTTMQNPDQYFKFGALTLTSHGIGAHVWKCATILGLIIAKKPASFLKVTLPHAKIDSDVTGASRMHMEHFGAMTDAHSLSKAMDKRQELSLLELAQNSPIDSAEKVQLLQAKFKATEKSQ